MLEKIREEPVCNLFKVRCCRMKRGCPRVQKPLKSEKGHVSCNTPGSQFKLTLFGSEVGRAGVFAPPNIDAIAELHTRGTGRHEGASGMVRVKEERRSKEKRKKKKEQTIFVGSVGARGWWAPCILSRSRTVGLYLLPTSIPTS